jgi:hypothetical protein
LATPAPAAAATSAAAVEMLNVRPPSPPVPAVSTRSALGVHGDHVIAHRLRSAGDLVSGLTLEPGATRNPPICAGVAPPVMIVPSRFAIQHA